MDLAALVAVLGDWGERRLTALQLLAEHPELDDVEWQGKVLYDLGRGGSIKGAVQPAPRELRAGRRNAA